MFGKLFSKLLESHIFWCLTLNKEFPNLYDSFTLFYLFWLWLLGVHNWEVGHHSISATAFDNILVAVIGDIMCKKNLLVVFIWSPISSINYLLVIKEDIWCTMLHNLKLPEKLGYRRCSMCGWRLDKVWIAFHLVMIQLCI